MAEGDVKKNVVYLDGGQKTIVTVADCDARTQGTEIPADGSAGQDLFLEQRSDGRQLSTSYGRVTGSITLKDDRGKDVRNTDGSYASCSLNPVPVRYVINGGEGKEQD